MYSDMFQSILISIKDKIIKYNVKRIADIYPKKLIQLPIHQ